MKKDLNILFRYYTIYLSIILLIRLLGLLKLNLYVYKNRGCLVVENEDILR